MRVKLLYFAALREQFGRKGEELELPADIRSVDALRQHLMSRGGVWEDALSGRRPLRVAVNQQVAEAGTAVRPGDEVAFFPPVTGG